MGYAGDERRVHKVFVTRNTEYHVRRGVCVGVKDRESGHWLNAHMALFNRVAGGLRFESEGGILPNPGTPAVGESLLFETDGRDIITSTVVSVERPSRDLTVGYPNEGTTKGFSLRSFEAAL